MNRYAGDLEARPAPATAANGNRTIKRVRSLADQPNADLAA